jgi:hypothetical protein
MLSSASLDSAEYQERESDAKEKGQDWATDKRNPKVSIAINHHEDDHNDFACLCDTKTSHHIPRSYKHAMATDPERRMVPMQVQMDTLKKKHTCDLVKPPPARILWAECGSTILSGMVTKTRSRTKPV